MYHLLCPGCNRKMATPFVRLGAVATCKHCNHRYRVEQEHIEALPIKPATDDDPLLPRVPAKPAAAAASASASTAVIETTPPPGAQSAAATAAADPASELARAAQGPTRSRLGKTLARRAIERRKRRPITVLMVVLIIIAAAVAIGVVIGVQQGYLVQHETTQVTQTSRTVLVPEPAPADAP